jgi:putative ABC transport system permease protein
VESAQRELTSRVRPILNVLIGAVVLVLVITCVNMANLTLARASSRVPEIAVRRALGATRSQVVRQLLAESTLLALAGAAAALGVLAVMKDSLVAAMPPDLPRLTELRFDGGIVALGIGLSIATGLVFGIVPALRVSGIDPGENLKEAGRGLGEALPEPYYTKIQPSFRRRATVSPPLDSVDDH